MRLLSITDPQIWLLAGISILVVFSILLILVAILNVFTIIAKKTTAKVKTVKSGGKELRESQRRGQGSSGNSTLPLLRRDGQS